MVLSSLAKLHAASMVVALSAVTLLKATSLGAWLTVLLPLLVLLLAAPLSPPPPPQAAKAKVQHNKSAFLANGGLVSGLAWLGLAWLG